MADDSSKTTGLEGEQRSSFVVSKRKRGPNKGGSNKKGKKGDSENFTEKDVQDVKKRVVFSDAPKIPKNNLAGRPDTLIRSEFKVRSNVVKVAKPYHQSQNLGTESYLHFVITSNKNEWIRFRPDGLSIVIYGNLTRAAGALGTAEDNATTWSLRARDGNPHIFIDPTVQMTGLVKSVDVTIDNVPVPTNSAIVDFQLHYTRYSRIFCKNPGPIFKRWKQVNFNQTGANMKSPMVEATDPFDHKVYNWTQGNRVKIFLDGIFPFSTKCKTLEAIQNEPAENVWFPPDVTIDIKVHMYRSKFESIFHSGIDSLTEYFNPAAVVNAPAERPTMSILSAELAYEVVELNQEDHVKSLAAFQTGGMSIYRYNIARGQHQTLTSGVSYTENVFQIMPMASLVFIAFLPDWATFVMEAKRKPLSGFSRFPANASKTEVTFASEPLVLKELENLGSNTTTHEDSKALYFEYLKKLGIANKLKFEDMFPRSYAGDGNYDQSLIQVLIYDLSNQLSQKTELLKISNCFGGGQTSPIQHQVLVISVHDNGKAICKKMGESRWHWEFAQNI